MNANRNRTIDFRINHMHDHYILGPDDRHVQPSFCLGGRTGDGAVTAKYTKKKRNFRKEKNRRK